MLMGTGRSDFGGFLERGKTSRPMRLLSSIAAIVISVFSIGLLWYLVPVDALLSAIVSIKLECLMASVVATLLNLLIRGIRWAIILGRRTPGDITIARYITIIGIGLNTLLPGKLGEIARLGLAVRYQRLSFGEAAGSTAGERLLDLFVLLSLFGITVPLLDDGARGHSILEDTRAAAEYLEVVTLFGAVSLILIGIPKINRAVRHLGFRALYRWRRGSRGFVRILLGVQRALATFGRPGVLAAALVATILMWLISGLGFFFSAQGATTISLSLLMAVALSTVTVLASALPSAPGAWGVYEAAGLAFLTGFYGTSYTPELMALLITIHATQVLTVIVCMLIAGFLLPRA